MVHCCICGNVADENAAGLMINGNTAPICLDCGKLLDAVEILDPGNPKRKTLHSLLRDKMRESGAANAVIETVDGFFANDPPEVKEYIDNEKIEYEKENREAAEPVRTVGRNIEGLCNFLSGFAVVFLICGILLSFIIGIPMIKNPYTSGNGWSVLIGGIIGTALTFAMILLVLSVASAIGKINDNLEMTNKKIEKTNNQLGRIVNLLSGNSQKQKK